MSDAGVLEAILAHPDDDGPRLIYAGWLEENGDPARAEFIRVQIELARTPPEHPERQRLQFREHDLLLAHKQRWLDDLPKWAVSWEWRRGLIEGVTTSAYVFLVHGNALAARTPLRRLVLRQTDNAQAAQLALMPALAN